MKANWNLEFGSGRSAVPLVLTLSVAWLLTAGVRGQVPRTATAEATIEEGCVVRIALTDAGACYWAPPTVTLSGGGGSGATAIATVRNGAVDRIALMQTGAGYSFLSSSFKNSVIADEKHLFPPVMTRCIGFSISHSVSFFLFRRVP